MNYSINIFNVLLLTLVFSILGERSYAADEIYVAMDLSYAGVTSGQEFTNGTQDQGKSYTVGYKFTEYSFEITHRKYAYTNTHTRIDDGSEVNDDISDSSVSFGVRGQHNEVMESKFGLSINNIVGTFIGADGIEYVSPVDGTYLGLYFGTGPKINFNGDLDLFFDFTLRRISADIFTVGYDFGLRLLF